MWPALDECIIKLYNVFPLHPGSYGAAPLTGIWACEETNNVKLGHLTQPHFRHPTSELGLGVSASQSQWSCFGAHVCPDSPETFSWAFRAREVEFQLHVGLKICLMCRSGRNCFHYSGLLLCNVLSCMHKAILLCQKVVKSLEAFEMTFKLTSTKSISIEMRDIGGNSEEATGTSKIEAEYIAGDSP